MVNVAGRLPVAVPRQSVWRRVLGGWTAARPAARASAAVTRPAVVAAVLVLGLIALHLAVHLDEGGWVAKVSWPSTTTLDGHLVAWEWIHVGETVAVIDVGAAPREISSQNLYRFVGGYLLALLREPLGGFYAGAVAAHVLAWIAAAWGVYLLATMAAGTPRAGVLAAAFAATGAGFVGYLGQVDAHPFAYAAVALYPALVERLGVFARSETPGSGWLRPVVAGLVLCVAAYTMEVGPPLLLYLWLVYGLGSLTLQRGGTGGPGLRVILARLAVLTGAFLGPYLAFQLLAEGVLFEQVATHNHPATFLSSAFDAQRQQGLPRWLSGRLGEAAARWPAAFPPVVSVLALIGAALMPRRWLLWAATFLVVFFAALALTKLVVRELYFLFPPVYVLAACGGERVAGWLARLAVPNASAAARVWLRRLALAGLLVAVVGVTNADLWGDYYLPAHWYQCKVTGC